MKTYLTKVTSFHVDGNNYLSIEVPEDFIDEMELHEGEYLQWEVDKESGITKITKTMYIDK